MVRLFRSPTWIAATQLDKTVTAKKKQSGPSQSYAARVEAGRKMLSTWLDSQTAADLDALAAAWKCTKQEAVAKAISRAKKSLR